LTLKSGLLGISPMTRLLEIQLILTAAMQSTHYSALMGKGRQYPPTKKY
jgi:hypothetical protein